MVFTVLMYNKYDFCHEDILFIIKMILYLFLYWPAHSGSGVVVVDKYINKHIYLLMHDCKFYAYIE